MLFLQNHQIQTYLATKITAIISNNIHAKIHIGELAVTFINRIQLKDIYVEDQQGDTLLYAEKIRVTIKNYSRSKKSMEISNLRLEDAYVNFISDTTGLLNVKFIIDDLKGNKEKDSTNFALKINNVELKNSRFHYTKEGRDITTTGINYANMDMGNLNAKLRDFNIQNDTISFSVRDMSLKEKSGFEVTEFNTDMSLSGRHMNFEHVNLKTPFSQIFARSLNLSFVDYSDFSDFVNLVGVNFNFISSGISFRDIAFFAPTLKDYNEEFKFSGLLRGQISNLRGDDLLLTYNNHSHIMANFTIIGLPDVKTAFMHYDITSLETNSTDIQEITIPGKNGNIHLSIPKAIAQLGEIKYTGKFTGYIDDFVAYGKFSTSLGEFSSDLLLKPDSANTLFFQGRLKTRQFHLGKLTNSESKIGHITMKADINGYTSAKGLFAKMDGVIDSLEFNQYNYKNINIAGTLTDKVFDGSFNITDPNIKMDFLGKVNFSSESPEFAFTADVSRARPYYLHLDNSDPSYFASFLLKTNFTGKSINELNGEIKIINSLFQKQEHQVQMYNFSLQAANSPDSNYVLINSDVIDAEIKGKYQFSKLPDSFKSLAAYYLPSLESEEKKASEESDGNSFVFNIKLKNIHPLVSFFLPDFDIGNNSLLSGHYFPASKDVVVNASSSLFMYKGNTWTNLDIHSKSDKTTVMLDASSDQLVFKNKMSVGNLHLNTEISKDAADLKIKWDSDSKPLFKGEITALANLSRNDLTDKPVIGLHFDPTDIIFNDTLWHVSSGKVVVDTSSVNLDSFTIRNHNQNFLVYGKISENPEDGLYFSFKDMDLTALNPLSLKYKFELAGRLSGKASITDPLHNLLFLSDLKMNDLIVNGETVGTGAVLANWNNIDKKVHIQSYLGNEDVPGLRMEGDFYPRTKALDFDLTLDKLRVAMFHPYMDFLVSQVKGIATGTLKLTGTGPKPDLNGTVRVMKSSLLVDYLQTRYNFSNDLRIVHNNIIVKDFEAFDEKGNKAVAQGTVSTKYWREFNLDVRVTTDNFEFLNTTEKDNQLFYGRIFGGGVVHVSGPSDNLLIDVDAHAEKNSIFYIPLYGTEEVQDQNFIDWVNPADINTETSFSETRYEVKLKGLQMNFNLDVNPNAEVQLIFDPKIGDIIKGRGTGTLKVLINTLGKFEIYGSILIDEGDYLFTLQNVINKKFVVEKGGRITWNGDPEDANIDMKAVYGLKTTISALDPDPTQQASRKRIPVDCTIDLSGKLMNPTIKPGISLPGSDVQTQNIVKNSINTDEEMMKQFVSLLVMNNFYSQQGIVQGGTGGTSSNVAGVTTSELLSNQLSSWLSQISNDFDIGINYRPGDQITSEELQVALSTQILNDRISISGNLDVGGNATTTTTTNTNNIVGDFDINFKITDKLHVKAFNRANDNLLFQTSPYTQGVGFFYREYFNTGADLGEKFKKPFVNLFSAKKPDETVPQEEQ
ncbi:MAG: translocation/assembly module TamB [Bacteroidales bacterium]|nr:translocation/assembly module TamB [Bacteroidales bacterium]